jgi:hypothetical protein
MFRFSNGSGFFGDTKIPVSPDEETDESPDPDEKT